ncbi:hypothetical protein J6590_057220 [Homalodisca vitripennis]|nr:hypothetical protein J6590_057220 [Homalodisca vitripennis]
MQWKVINEVTGSAINKSVQKVELDNGEIVTESLAVAEVINNYLINIQSTQTVGSVHQARVTYPHSFSLVLSLHRNYYKLSKI